MPSVFTRTLLSAVLATISLGAMAATPAAPAAPAPMPGRVTPQVRSMEVLRAFAKLCNAPQLTFDTLSARATAAGMKVVPGQAATGVRAGRWSGAVPSGDFVLLVDETRGIKGVTTSCGVAAEVGDTEVFRAAAIKTMSLRAGVQPDISTEGGRTFDFGIVRPPSTRIAVRDFKPKGLSRVMVSVSAVAPGH